MFEIEYKGGNAVELATKYVTLVFDPKRSLVGLRDIVISGGVEVGTEKRFLTGAPEYKLSIDGPGEYEVSDVAISGFRVFRQLDDPSRSAAEGTFYTVDADGTRVAVLGNIENSLSEEQLDELGAVHILVIPVGGNGYSPDAEIAANLVKAIEPKIVIPVSYADSSLNYEVPQDSVDLFVQAIKAPVKEESKLKVKNGLLPESLEIWKLKLSI